MPEPQSIREICRGLINQSRARRGRFQQELTAQQATAKAIVNEMESIVEELRNLPMVPGASYPDPPLILTGIDKMELATMGIDAWK